MIPKNEKELELYFMLEQLSFLNKKKAENFVYLDTHYKQLYSNHFEELKIKYL